MRILLISTSFNTFTQRVFTDLIGAGHEVSVKLPFSLDAMREAVDQFEPDLVLCPFLKQIVPEDIWKTHLTIIMHPGIKGDRGPSSIDWAIMETSREWGVTALENDPRGVSHSRERHERGGIQDRGSTCARSWQARGKRHDTGPGHSPGLPRALARLGLAANVRGGNWCRF